MTRADEPSALLRSPARHGPFLLYLFKLMSQHPTLRRNHGRYLGERIEVEPVQQQLLDAAKKHGWRTEVFLDQPGRQLHAFHRPTPGARPRI